MDKGCKLESLTQIQVQQLSVKVILAVCIVIMVGVFFLHLVSCSNYTTILETSCFPIRCPHCNSFFIAVFVLNPFWRSACRSSIILESPFPFVFLLLFCWYLSNVTCTIRRGSRSGATSANCSVRIFCVSCVLFNLRIKYAHRLYA